MNPINELHIVKGLDPVADAFAATVYSDVVNMEGHEWVSFVIYKGVGTTGTSTVTVQACDDVTPSNRTAIPFWRKAITTGDTEGTLTRTTATGFDTTAGSSQLYHIVAKADDLAATGGGYGYVQLKCVESTDAAVLGGILILQSGKRYTQAQGETTIT